jgi:hypothetical protein
MAADDAIANPERCASPSAPNEMRAVQHRVRNDFQTLGALWRVAGRRASAETLVSEFPSWLDALAAVYDSVPLWVPDDRVMIGELLSAIRSRCDIGAPFEVKDEVPSCLPTQMAIVGVLALVGILKWCAQSASANETIRVRVYGDEGETRVDAVFRRGLQAAEWPPLGLSLAAEAAGAEFAFRLEGPETTATLVIPCR